MMVGKYVRKNVILDGPACDAAGFKYRTGFELAILDHVANVRVRATKTRCELVSGEFLLIADVLGEAGVYLACWFGAAANFPDERWRALKQRGHLAGGVVFVLIYVSDVARIYAECRRVGLRRLLWMLLRKCEKVSLHVLFCILARACLPWRQLAS